MLQSCPGSAACRFVVSGHVALCQPLGHPRLLQAGSGWQMSGFGLGRGDELGRDSHHMALPARTGTGPPLWNQGPQCGAGCWRAVGWLYT